MTELINADLIADMQKELDERQGWEGQSYSGFRPHRANMRWSTRAIMAEAEIDRLQKQIAEANNQEGGNE